MKKTLFLLPIAVVALVLVSCSDQYVVSGSSTVNALEGKKLYLKVFDEGKMTVLDSTKVVHGKFEFKGVLDTTILANLYLEDADILPVVLEGGEAKMQLDEAVQTIKGTPLNDTLNAFIVKKNQIDAQLAALPRRESQLIMDGLDHEQIMAILYNEQQKLLKQNDDLITSFIKDNYTNVLGPGMFRILTEHVPYPVLTPQLEAILTGAPDYFTNHPYVKKYVEEARKRQEEELLGY